MKWKSNIEKIISLFVVICIFLSTVSISYAADIRQEDEFDKLRQKWYENYTGGDYDPKDPDIAKFITNEVDPAAKMRLDWIIKDSNRSYFSENLKDTTRSVNVTSIFKAIKLMARGYTTKGSIYYENEEILKWALDGLEWAYNNVYNENTPSFDNWYELEIGTPLEIVDAVTLLYDKLTQEQVQKYMRAVFKFCKFPEDLTKVPTGDLMKYTSANGLWRCKVLAIAGILAKDPSKIVLAREGLSRELKLVTSGDGFYEDGSYIFHEFYAYNGGYGKALLVQISSIVYILGGSTWNIPEDKLKLFYDLIYNAYEPLIYNGKFMDMVRGRDISREGYEDINYGLETVRALAEFAGVAPAEHAVRLKSMVKAWLLASKDVNPYSGGRVFNIIQMKKILDDSNIKPREELITHKTYAAMDRVVHLRPGFGFGISMYSNRIHNYEAAWYDNAQGIADRFENFKGWYTGEGMTYMYNDDGTAYNNNFWATVDYYRLPGTTVDKRPKAVAKYESRRFSNRSWVGGTDILGLYGAAGMDVKANNSSLNAKKSWFMFDDEVVCVGSGINSTDNFTVETIVENRKLNKPNGNNTLSVNGIVKPAEPGWYEEIKDASWAYLEGTGGYYFPEKTTIKTLRESRTGNWKESNTYQSAKNYTNNFATLWVDHGRNPVDATYSYVLLPNKTSDQVAAYSQKPDITILKNTSEVQAVKENRLNITGINFWSAGVSEPVQSLNPASVMLSETDNDLEVAVSDPTQENKGIIELIINRTAGNVISKDNAVTVTQLSPVIKLSVNVKDAKGKTFRVKLDKADTQLQTQLSIPAPAAKPAADVAPKPYAESNGIVSIEAENWFTNEEKNGYTWLLNNSKTGFSGTGTMSLLPDRPRSDIMGYVKIPEDMDEAAPVMTYKVDFKTTGKYYVWLRGNGNDTEGNTIHLGIDGDWKLSNATSSEVSFTSYGWKSNRLEIKDLKDTRPFIEVTEPGIHTLNVWMCEDGASLDKIVLTTDEKYVPTGMGPMESSISNTSYTRKFSDLQNYDWAAKEIEELSGRGIIKGTSAVTFDPSSNTSRADFIVLLTRTLGLDARKVPFSANFSDVDKSDYYYEALGIAKKLGITDNWVVDDKFDPKADITRQEMMVLISKALRARGLLYTQGTIEDLDKFADKADVAENAVADIAAIVKEGVIEGSGSTLNPNATASRAEIAVIMYRIYFNKR